MSRWSKLPLLVIAGLLQMGIARTVTAQAPTDAAGQRRELEAFRRDFLAPDSSYTMQARAAAERRLAALEQEAGTIDATRLELRLAQIAALADNGHTLMIPRGTAALDNRVPVRLVPMAGGFYVLRATSPHADLLGGRLVSVDGVPLARLRDSGSTLAGGTVAHRDTWLPAFLESPGQMHALGLVRDPARARYRFVMPDGATREAELAGEAVAGMEHGSLGAMDPEAGEGWRSVLASSKAPWALQQFHDRLRRVDAPEIDAIVIQLRAMLDGDVPIARFLEEADSVRRAAGRRNVVLDLRFNGGGNLQLARDVLVALPSRLPAGGRIIVLTSPFTFSAAISSTGYLKQAGGDRVTIVGEEVGDRLEFWAEGQPVGLPSGSLALPARQRHDYANGCRAYSDCHQPVVQHPIAVSTLAPDVSAPWTLETYAAGRDPGMEAVAKLLAPRP